MSAIHYDKDVSHLIKGVEEDHQEHEVEGKGEEEGEEPVIWTLLGPRLHLYLLWQIDSAMSPKNLAPGR